MGIEKYIFLGLYRKREHGMLSSQDSDELKKRVSKKAKLENERKLTSATKKIPRRSEEENVVFGRKYSEDDNRKN